MSRHTELKTTEGVDSFLLSFTFWGSNVQTQFIRLSHKHPYSLSHFASPHSLGGQVVHNFP